MTNGITDRITNGMTDGMTDGTMNDMAWHHIALIS